MNNNFRIANIGRMQKEIFFFSIDLEEGSFVSSFHVIVSISGFSVP